METIKFEADSAGFQQVWNWLVATPLQPLGLYVPLLESASDHRRNVRLTGASIRARGKAIYVIDFTSTRNAVQLKVSFWDTDIIRFID